MHDLDLDHEHLELSEEQRLAIAQSIWEQENVELKTVGIDIGSSTSHLLFAKVVLQRQTQGLSSRFVVIDRQVVWRSPIMLTPFLKDGTIDAHKLGHFIHDAYHAAGLQAAATSTAAPSFSPARRSRRRTRAPSTKCSPTKPASSSAPPPATSSNACSPRTARARCALSKERDTCVLHVDIGGGTTKLALIDKGKLVGLSAFAVGGRLICARTTTAHGRVSTIPHTRSPGNSALRPIRQALPIRRPPPDRQPFRELAADQIPGEPLDTLGREFCS